MTTPELAARIEELRSLPWQQQRAIAASLGLTKPSDQTWDDLCEAIAIAEQATTEPVEEDTPESIAPPALVAPSKDYAFSGGVCGACGERIRTDLYGALMCPSNDTQCPREGK